MNRPPACFLSASEMGNKESYCCGLNRAFMVVTMTYTAVLCVFFVDQEVAGRVDVLVKV